MLVLIDGRTVYTPLFSGVFWEAQDVMLEDVERIEVVTGRITALWGTNAVDGLIQIINKPAAATRGAFAGGEVGNRERGGAVRFGGETGSGENFRIYGKSYDRSTSHRADGSSINDAADGMQVGFRADWSRQRDAFTVQGDAHRGTIDQAPAARKFSRANVVGRWQRSLDRLQHTSHDERVAVARHRDARVRSTPRHERLAREDAGKHSGTLLVGARRRHRAGRDVRRHEGTGRDDTAHLLGDDGQVEQAAAAEAAATVGFGDEERREPELGGLAPPRRIEALSAFGPRPHGRDRALVVQEFLHRLVEQLLIVGESQVHASDSQLAETPRGATRFVTPVTRRARRRSSPAVPTRSWWHARDARAAGRAADARANPSRRR